MKDKNCGNCKYWSFNKISPNYTETRHYCNLAIQEGRFDDKECYKFDTEYCDRWEEKII